MNTYQVPLLSVTPSLFAPLPQRTYEIIYADPPWAYSDKSLNRGGAERHYQTVGINELKTLPVASIADRDSALILWATWPTLSDAFELIKAWGFTYKTCLFCWVKQTKDGSKFTIGGGAYTRANSEPCLLATRGNVLRRYSRSVRQILTSDDAPALVSPRGLHSVKPPEARDRIVELFGEDRSRIELFARSSPIGWDVWGDQAPLPFADEIYDDLDEIMI
jgi:N6-adenosine-specific RNA methylase IME4